MNFTVLIFAQIEIGAPDPLELMCIHAIIRSINEREIYLLGTIHNCCFKLNKTYIKYGAIAYADIAATFHATPHFLISAGSGRFRHQNHYAAAFVASHCFRKQSNIS